MSLLRLAPRRLLLTSRPIPVPLAASFSSSALVSKKGSHRSRAPEGKRAQRDSDPKASAHDIRPHPEPKHPYDGSDDLGATETAQAGLETEVMNTKGKGKKKGKAKTVDAEDMVGDDLEGGKFDLKGLNESMNKVVDRLRKDMNNIVGRVGTLHPSLLDHIKVSLDEGELGTAQGGSKGQPLTGFANVTVRDSEHLLVTCYDPSFIRPVELALYNDPMNLSPIKADDGTITVSIPKPSMDHRRSLVRQAAQICEQSRLSLRSLRQSGQKASKKDLDANLITQADHRKDGYGLDEETKRWSKEVDGIEEKAKKILLDQ